MKFSTSTDCSQVRLAGFFRATIIARRWSAAKQRESAISDKECSPQDEDTINESQREPAGYNHRSFIQHEKHTFPCPEEIQTFELEFLKYYHHYISLSTEAEHSTEFISMLQYYMYHVLNPGTAGYTSISQMHDSMIRRIPDDSYQREVFAFGWDDYSEAIRKDPSKSKLLGKRYLGRKLLFIFLVHRKHIPLFNDWEGAPHLIITITSNLLEKRNSGKWKRMISIKERFLECYKTVFECLQGTENPMLRKLASTAFKTPQNTWNHAMLAVVEDIQHDHIPRNLGDFLAFLVQAWAVASSEHPEYEVHSAAFYSDLQRWALAANERSSTYETGYSRAVDIFIVLVWPEWDKHDIPWSTPDCGSFRASLPSIELVKEKILSDPTEPELALARSLVAYLVGEHADLYRRSEVSLEAATIGVILKEPWGPGPKTQSVSYNHTQAPSGSQFYIPDKHIPGEQIPDEAIFRYLACGFIFLLMVGFWADATQFSGSPVLVIGTLSPDNTSHFVHVGKKRRKILQTQSPNKDIGKSDKVIRDVIEHVDKGAISYTTWPALVVDIQLLGSSWDEIVFQVVIEFFWACAQCVMMEGVLPLGGYPAVVKDTSTQSRYTTTHIVEDTNSSCAISSAQNLESFISTPSVAKYGGNLPFDIRPSLSSPTAQETPASDTETMDIDTDYDLDDSTVRSERLSSTPHTMTQGPSPAGSMEFQCSVCSMGFRNTTNLKRHERSVHGDKVPCVWCHKPGRNRPDYIKKHQGTCKKKPRGSGTMGGRS